MKGCIILANVEFMEYILMGIILICGYFFLFNIVSAQTENRRSIPVLAVVLFVVYAIVTIPLMIILMQMGETSFVLLALLLLMACTVLVVLLGMLIRNFSLLNKKVLVLFLLYVIAVSYITIFSRSEGHSRAILLRFDSFRAVLQQHSLEPLNHVFLNAVMFVPLGFLFAMIHPGYLDKFLLVGPFGLMMSTMIEATQMFLTIGQCDVEDIFANTLGAVIGLILFKVYAAFFMQSDDEDDE